MAAITVPTFTVDTDADVTIMNALRDCVAAIEQRTIPSCHKNGAIPNEAEINLERLYIEMDITPGTATGTDATRGNRGCSYQVVSSLPSWCLDVQINYPANLFTHDTGHWKVPLVLGPSVGAGVAAPDYYQTLTVSKTRDETDTGFIQRFILPQPMVGGGVWDMQFFSGMLNFRFRCEVVGLRKTQPT